MRKLVLLTALAFAVSGGAAQANIMGTVYTFGTCGGANPCAPTPGASPGNAIDSAAFGVNSGGTVAVTFSIPNGGIDMTSGANYSIAEFLNSNVGGAATILTGVASSAANSLGNTLIVFTGSVSVTNGEPFIAGHDDGLTFMVGSTQVIGTPGPTAFASTPGTYGGPSGNFAFTLTYGECCGSPARLQIAGLSLQTLSVPGPIVGAGLPGLIAACGGLIALARRRRRKAA